MKIKAMNHTPLKIKQNPEVNTKFENYPSEIQPRMNNLRNLILESAEEDGLLELEETLKWGEPSYLAKKGSTLRIDWKAKSPEQYAMYFKCTSLLVPTIREVFGDTFRYEKNRALLFDLNEALPEQELKTCIKLALKYHKIKHLPLLGL